MKLSIFAAISAGYAAASDVTTTEPDFITPVFPEDDFVQQLMANPQAKIVMDWLDDSQSGSLRRAISETAFLIRAAPLWARRYRNETAIVRKNLLNALRVEAAQTTDRFCQPRGHWFCSYFADVARYMVSAQFCSKYSTEARRETCVPEAQADYARVLLLHKWG